MTRESAKVAKKTLAKGDAAKTPRKAMPNPIEQPKLLSGGNPRIAKGYGDAPVHLRLRSLATGHARRRRPLRRHIRPRCRGTHTQLTKLALPSL
jgi:hypothetical protein